MCYIRDIVVIISQIPDAYQMKCSRLDWRWTMYLLHTESAIAEIFDKLQKRSFQKTVLLLVVYMTESHMLYVVILV